MLLETGRTAGDERTLVRDRLDRRRDGAPVSDERLVRVEVSAEDVHTEVGEVDGRAHERDEAVPAADTPVETVLVPRLAVFRQGLWTTVSDDASERGRGESAPRR